MEEKEKAWPKLARFTSYDGINKVFNLNNGCSFWVEFVFSKRYEFIKWLVENNKINFDKVNKVYYKKIYCWTDWKYISYAEFLDEEILIMRLSISDSPVNDLISYLK